VPSAAAATAAAQAETARIATGSLPAPPPLSAPLGVAGTGPMPQLSQTMAPPGSTIWWSTRESGSSQGTSKQASRGPAPGAPVPGPTAPKPPAKTKPGRAVGAIALSLGLLLLIIGAVAGGHGSYIVIIGLVAGAWGMWRLITGASNKTKPPGQT